MSVIKYALGILFALCVSFPAFADWVIQAPTYAVGDTWVIERTVGKKAERRVVKVLQVSKEEMVAEVNDAAGKVSKLTYTADGNIVSMPSATFKPFRTTLQFPLTSDKKWQGVYMAEFTANIQDPARRTFKVEHNSRVVGLEQVALPHGTVRAVRIESKLYYGGINVTENVWYSPDLKMVVQHTWAPADLPVGEK